MHVLGQAGELNAVSEQYENAEAAKSGAYCSCMMNE